MHKASRFVDKNAAQFPIVSKAAKKENLERKWSSEITSEKKKSLKFF